MTAYNQNDHMRMLKDIGIVSFVLVELTLYLDTHPLTSRPWNTSTTTPA